MTARFPVRPWFRISLALPLVLLTAVLGAIAWGPFSDHSEYSRSLRGLLALAPVVFILGVAASGWSLFQLRPSELIITPDAIRIPAAYSSRSQTISISDIEAIIVQTDARAGRVVDLHLNTRRRARVLVNMVHDRDGLVEKLSGIEGVDVSFLDRPANS